MADFTWPEVALTEVHDEISGWPIGSGYDAPRIGWDDAEDIAPEVLDALAPIVADMLAQARAEGAAEVADAWQHGGWADVLMGATVQERMRNAQRVTDWLRARTVRG